MTEFPEYRPWSLAAVRLLQGVVYVDDQRVWDALLSYRSQLEEYFQPLGLQLVIDEPEGFGFLRQCDAEELPADYQSLPKLFRRTTLSYSATLLCVVLRDRLRLFEEEELENQRCVVETAALLEDFKPFYPATTDDVKCFRELSAALRKLEEFRFVRRFGDEPEAWEIRRILKARLPASQLQQLRDDLLAIATGPRRGDDPAANSPDQEVRVDG